jgi:hypothetical protein
VAWCVAVAVAVVGVLMPSLTARATASECVGDCSGVGIVGISQLIRGVGIALGTSALSTCPAFDISGDGVVEINELIAAVNAALNGCPAEPTPTATPVASLAEIQQIVFSPRCAIINCHDYSGQQADLILEPDKAYAQLVGSPPSNGTAADAGLLRVDPGHPENSFLLVKLTAPGTGEGGQMPLGGPALAPKELELIRDWIANGAKP